ncbi:MAG: GNAT family N-acetyltransferase, partial [Paludibacter sp.]
RYALLRAEFIEQRKHSKIRTGFIKHILICFGGVDSDNNTALAIHALENINDPRMVVDVIIGIQHPFLEQIKALCINNKFHCHIQTKRMAELIQSADLAIGAGGISTYERLFLKLRAIIKPVSLNQIAPLTYMSSLGLFDLFSSQDDLENKIRNMLGKDNFSPPDCVEDGSNKLAKLLIENFTFIGFPKALDIRRTFAWLQNKQLRDDFVIARSPLRHDHFIYWRKLLNDPRQCVFAINFSGKHVGNCGLKNIDTKSRSCEMWVYVADPSARGRGVASSAVRSLLEKAKNDLLCVNIYLHVLKTNFLAIKLYKNCGFVESSKPLDGRWVGQEASIAFMERAL